MYARGASAGRARLPVGRRATGSGGELPQVRRLPVLRPQLGEADRLGRPEHQARCRGGGGVHVGGTLGCDPWEHRPWELLLQVRPFPGSWREVGSGLREPSARDKSRERPASSSRERRSMAVWDPVSKLNLDRYFGPPSLTLWRVAKKFPARWPYLVWVIP